MTGETLRFTKGHGTENDFVLLFDAEGQIDLTPDMVRALCDRRGGIGGDGVIRVVRVGRVSAAMRKASALEGQPKDRWFMDYWNSDGTTAEMCGNGIRVFAALLERDAEEDLSGGLEIATRSGTRTVRALGDGTYAADMGPWAIPGDGVADIDVSVRGLDGARPGISVNMSNPHAVVAVSSEEELRRADLLAAPVLAPAPSAGANVELVVPLRTVGAESDGEEAVGFARMRVHERGSGETRSCGTGACAAALAVRAWAGPGAPRVWHIEVPGGRLTVRIEDARTILEGPAVLVADGEVSLAAIGA